MLNVVKTAVCWLGQHSDWRHAAALSQFDWSAISVLDLRDRTYARGEPAVQCVTINAVWQTHQILLWGVEKKYAAIKS